MKKHQLKPGYYKVQKADYSSPYGAKHARPNTNTIRMLRVEKLNTGLRYYLDTDTIGFTPTVDNMKELEILSHYTDLPKLKTQSIVISLIDTSMVEFRYSFKNIKALAHALRSCPHLKPLIKE